MSPKPFSTAFSFTSRSTTLMPCWAQDMAMPPPMSPAPTMPTEEIFCGFVVKPSIFPPARSAKNMYRKAVDSDDEISGMNCFASALAPSANVGPAQAASTHLMIACGAGSPRRSTAIRLDQAAKSHGAGAGRALMLVSGFPICRLQKSIAAARISAPVGTTSSTTPSSRALGPYTWLPLVMSSNAFSEPIRRGRRCVPCPPGKRPMFTSGSPTNASSAMMRYWQPKATSNPPPRAKPWMAATTGTCSSSVPNPKASVNLRPSETTGTSSAEPNWLMSAPPQKQRPAPRITTPFTSLPIRFSISRTDETTPLRSFWCKELTGK
mmetsp:Transcript_97668/g.252750  ORF Transcript_97668/g.252750 Transcript_97668/m.252750 type:complete len:322 (-) Transcript_97668:129-1094(-)